MTEVEWNRIQSDYETSQKALQLRLVEQIQWQFKINLEGFRSLSDDLKIGDDFVVRRQLDDRDKFFERAASFDKTYRPADSNQFFAFYDFQMPRGGGLGVAPSRHLDFVASFLAVCWSHSIQANTGQLFATDTEPHQSMGFFHIPQELIGTSTEKFSDSDVGLMRALWPNFKRIYFESKQFALVARRYHFSLTRHHWEDRLIDLFICLEAFCLPEKDASQKNKGGKVAKRISKLVSSLWSRSGTTQVIDQCYQLRNKVVHGDNVDELDSFAYDLVTQLSTITKYAIHEYLINYSKFTLSETFEQLDSKSSKQVNSDNSA